MKKLYAALLVLTSFISFAQLQVSPLPDYSQCDDNADGFATFDLNTIRQMLYMDYPPNAYTVAFYVNAAAAQVDTRLPLQYTNVTANTQTLVVKVWETANAANAGFTTLTLVVNPTPIANSTILSVCDDNNDEMAMFDLTATEAAITGGLPYMVSYYESLADTEGGMPITQPNNYMSRGPVTVIYVKVESVDGCSAIALLDLRVNALPYVASPLPVINSCPLVNLTANSNLYANYTATYYTTEANAYAGTEAISEPQEYYAQASGSVWVRISDTTTGCFIVVEQAYVISPIVEINITQNGNSVTIDTNGRTDISVFTLVSAPPSFTAALPLQQNSPEFNDLPAGGYTISLQDACGNMVIIEFEVIDAPEGTSEQTFTEGQTLAALSVSGGSIEWYADEELTQHLPITTLLADSTTYYATRLVNGNKSIPLAVTARLVAGNNVVNTTIISLYPNPVNELLTVSANSTINTLTVYTLTGQKVLTTSPDTAQTTLSMGSLQAGMYFLRISTASGSETVRVVKK